MLVLVQALRSNLNATRAVGLEECGRVVNTTIHEALQRSPPAHHLQPRALLPPAAAGSRFSQHVRGSLGLVATAGGPSKPFFPRLILPNFSVLARACLWRLGARMWRVKLPSCVKSIPIHV